MFRPGQRQFLPAQRGLPVEKSPLLIVLHGRGDSMKPFLDFRSELGIPEMNMLLINGHRRLGDGFAWCGLNPTEANGLAKSRHLLGQTLDELVAMGWNERRIFLLGFSEGALTALDFVLQEPRSLGGVISVSGCVHFPKRLSRSLKGIPPLLFTHGWLDEVLLHEDTQRQALVLKARGAEVDFHSFPKGHEIDSGEELALIRSWILRCQNHVSTRAGVRDRDRRRLASEPARRMGVNRGPARR